MRQRTTMYRMILSSCIVVALLATGLTLQAQVEPEKPRHIAAKAFRHADLDIAAVREQAHDLATLAGEQARARMLRLGANVATAHLDKRSGRPVTLLPEGIALVPGRGNNLSWGDVGLIAADAEARDRVAGDALMGYLEANQADLGIAMAELSPNARYASHGDGDLYQFYIPRQVGGIPVEGSFISATIGQGNLTLMSVNHWGDVRQTAARLSSAEAMDAVRSYLSPIGVVSELAKPELRYVPMAKGRAASDVVRGDGYRYELVWVLHVQIQGDQGAWQLYVDQRGNVLKFEDTHAYAEAKGGVYPKTNDGIVPDGEEQEGWPMPWMNVGSATTDTGGNYNLTGNQTATFTGPYVNMNDNCGSASLTQSGGIDWGASGGTDCTTPGFGGAGNTHSSRSGFYELNRIAEMARGQLPTNTWLTQQLTANMNINNTCNAFFSTISGTVNFYRSGGGCANTGEIAAVFDHEWGHAMDWNDVVGGIASPSGEGIADMYSALRLNDSCIGRNFQPGVNCSGFGDPCLNCSGVRDIDYEMRQSGNPHTYTWSNSNCGGSVHCVGAVYAEAMWNLWKRELPTLYGMDNNTAQEIVTRLTYIAGGNTSTWFSGGPPNGGCGGSSGYMNYLAADDDNGNLNDGTPHMQAIFNAFDTQEIACGTPTVQDSGCAGTPTQAPNVTTLSGDQQISLSWNAITGASSYQVFRTEGIFNCDWGKVLIGETAGTNFTDTNLQNGRDYSYVVIPKGSSDACFGSASACDTNQPGQVPCGVDADCDDGAFCNGAETCNAGFCQAGTDPCAANPTWTCDEVADVCVPECNVDADCDDGAFCNGAESCNAGTCEAGSDPCAGQCCDEGTDSCGISNDPQNAVYDAGLGAPVCDCGSSCDSQGLLDSRDNLSPAEPNSPNTLDSCTDGSSGSYHNDESNDRIVVTNLSGTGFTEGDTVEIAATVWAWSTGSSDTADFYYTDDANNPNWIHITSIVPPSGGAHTLTAQYVLPAGSLQAVRVNFRYSGSQSPCSGGSYDDADDLVFNVASAGPICVVDADCDDGAFCNGAEVCNAGTCEAGTPPACDDGQFCNGTETCNEGTDTCDAGTPPACDDGLFCNGTETCNEGTDSCDAGTPPACDDGQFCNGTETCNESTDSCDPGSDPCGGGACDEVGDVCLECTVDADCNDGAFCNGVETCNAGSCQAGTPPACDDGLFCNGTETCNEGTDSCDAGTPPACDDGQFCNGTETCNEATDSCDAGTPPACDDGLFCNGTETCNEGTDSCDAGTAPDCDDGVSCTVDSCNEGTDSCDNVANDGLCPDDGAFCNGTEFCDAVLDCQSTGDPCGAGETCNESTDICEGGGAPVLYMSFRSNTAVPGVGTVTDEDVVSYDTGSGTWALEFDGSDVGLGSFEIDGLAILPGGDLLLSFRQAGTIGGVSADDSDVVRFTGTGGANTSGTFSLYFDGSSFGLTSNGEDVDALTLDANGDLVVSTQGGFSGTGASGADEDLFVLSGGSFSLLFDGSDVGQGGNGNADTDAATFTGGGSLLMSIVGTATLSGVAIDDEDVAEFNGSFGSSTSGTHSMYLDLSALGIATSEDIGSLHIED